MSASVPVIAADPGSVPDDAALERELWELAKQYPEPDWRDVGRDWDWFYQEAAKGHLDHLFGKVVAVYNQQVVGVGDHYLVMLKELVRRYNQHPGRFYITYHGDIFDPN
jgi:hypothetical protein